MKCFGLIGYPLSHSFSKKYFTSKFRDESITDCFYENFPLEHIEQLHNLIYRQSDLAGLNVTIPYKEKIVGLLDELDDHARSVGAVNTVKIKRSAKSVVLKGFNTDIYGFQNSLAPHLRSTHKNALILGTGGASKAVAFVLNNLNISVTFISRRPSKEGQISYHDLSKDTITNSQIIINTSPVGMFPDIHSCPNIPYQFLTQGHILFDLIYNPLETQFLKKGRSMGAIVLNGLKMLHDQAEKAWEIWNDPEQ